MNYTVIWLQAALDQLADIWTAAPNREAITAASHQMDLRLAADPLNEGESRGPNERIAFEPPLRVLFTVFEDRRAVEVGSVGVFGRRGGA